MSDLKIYRVVIEAAPKMRSLLEQMAKHDADLAKQCRRAFTSIALNLAEGSRQRGGHARMRFQTAMGSADEVKACIEVSAGLGYFEPKPELVDLFDRVARTTHRLMR